MSLSYLPVEFWFEALSLIVSILVIKRLKGSFLAFIVPMLAITVACEFAGAYYKHVLHQSNGWIYNIVTLTQVGFWLLLFQDLIKGGLAKKVSSTLLIAFFLFGIINLFVIQGWANFNNNTLIIGSAMIIYHSCLYLYQYKNKAGDVLVLKDASFYLASGPLLFFTGTFVFFAVYSNLTQLRSQSTTRILQIILKDLNIVYYGCISIGLLLTNKNK